MCIDRCKPEGRCTVDSYGCAEVFVFVEGETEGGQVLFWRGTETLRGMKRDRKKEK